ncbi:MAG: DUF2769 domain-containing protein [Candidatus Heimdallarchaeota archaeon]
MIEDESFSDKAYEEKIKIMSGMTEKEISDGLEQVKFMCKDYCGKCPSYQGTGETDLGFCSIGKSSKIKEKKGCLCKQCPIYKMMSLRWEYYCTDGSALELSNAEK